MYKHPIMLSLILFILSFPLSLNSCIKGSGHNGNYEKAGLTLKAVYTNYSVSNTNLMRENFPFNRDYIAEYLADDEQRKISNPYSYLWPYSGNLSATIALYEVEKDPQYLDLLENKVIPGLQEYYDTRRSPDAYASYINTAPLSDRFYDDNVWLGLDFTDLYMLTSNQKYLDKAKLIWKFIESGTDSILGGGIYWCEQKKESKNTCSNAPGSVLALKLFMATGDSTYFYQGKALYEWTKQSLQDTDYLYFDNIRLDGEIGKHKFAYNSGQMMQSASLLHKLTNNKKYLTDAQNIANACYDYFFTNFEGQDGKSFRLIRKGDVWFTAIMLRGFIELYHLDKNKIYLNSFNDNLNYAWTHSREENGLFNKDMSGKERDAQKWLLTQAAMVEMYARLGALNKEIDFSR